MSTAFKMAVDDDAIRKNPFSFRVSDVVSNNTKKVKALTEAETTSFLEFLLSNKCGRKHYDEIVILLQTGLRVSELCGLIISDIDFKEHRICVERQLQKEQAKGCKVYIEEPKTESGKRFIPMTMEVEQAFRNVLGKRPTVPIEIMIDGYTGFVFLDREGKPAMASHFEDAMKRLVDKYNQNHSKPIEATPHVLRHTFCTNLKRACVPLKEAQYLMGHSDAGTTLNVYTDSGYEDAKEALKKAFVLGQVGT